MQAGAFSKHSLNNKPLIKHIFIDAILAIIEMETFLFHHSSS
jgi:hypothetical protein